MITKIEGTKNGYSFTLDSTNKELADVLHSRPNVRCIIVNYDGMAFFKVPLMGRTIFTVNNRVGDMEFYINTVR